MEMKAGVTMTSESEHNILLADNIVIEIMMRHLSRPSQTSTKLHDWTYCIDPFDSLFPL
jgi:hypothetical protein